MPEPVAYGFAKQKAAVLSRMADKELLRTGGGSKVGYPKPIAGTAVPKLAKLDGSLAQGGTATATEIIHNGTAFVYGDEFTVTDFFQNLTESIDADTKIIAFPIGDLWIPIPYCAVSDTLPA